MPQSKLAVGAFGDKVGKVQKTLAQQGFDLPASEVERQFFGPGTRDAIIQFQRSLGIGITGDLDETTKAAIEKSNAAPSVNSVPPTVVEEVGAATHPGSSTGEAVTRGGQGDSSSTGTGRSFKVSGTIIYEQGLPAAKIKVRLYKREFGGTKTLLGTGETDAEGKYEIQYRTVGPANIELYMVKTHGEEVQLSRTKFDAATDETLNLVAPAIPLQSEYRRLAADLKPIIGDMKKLADAIENTERQDLTILNRDTGWDARLLALASKAAKLSADAEVRLSIEALYGLFRAGLPSVKMLLAQVGADAAEQAMKKVRDAGIVALSDQQIGEFKQQFTAFSNRVRLTIPAPGSRSTYGQLLESSGVFPNNDEGKKARENFVNAFLNNRGDTAKFWGNARKPVSEGGANLTDTKISTLQLQGKFAFLAGNSEAMTSRLMKMSINDPVQLVEQGFYMADKWKVEIRAVADNDEQKLADLIPSAYPGDAVEERLNTYAEDMARKVRLSYPTHVVGRLIETDEKFKPLATNPNTVTLLKNAAGQGFRLGQTPVAAFLKTHSGVTVGMDAAGAKAAQLQLQTLQRVYQITPSNEAMPVMMSLGMTSAYDVMAYSEDEFIDLYVGKFFELYGKNASKKEPQLVYRKAQQVSSVTYNLFTIAKKMDSEPAIAGMSAPVEVRESVCNELIKQFPTMESLFGSMDYCECDHCRSVLSPAAYLVDLLQFVDAEPDVWANFLALWAKNHNGHAYTGSYTLDGRNYAGKYLKPYDALIARRPDLPHIPLTCENTYTAMPYIDIVNEILEYYVANGKLEEKAVHDTGDAASAELLAEPQNVIREAYDKLFEAHYPLNLPFDLWLETVRQFCKYFETPMDRVLEVLRPSDDVFAPTQPYDRAAIFMESLGLSLAEVAIFTNTDPLGNDKWQELYGFPTIKPSIQNPTNDEQATLTIANEDAEKFKEGFVCTYFDVIANVQSVETNAILTIAASDSGGAGQTLITFDDVWTTPPVSGDLFVCDTPATLTSAKSLSRRLGVTYKEIAEIVQTGFVNPKMKNLTILYKLGVSIQSVRFCRDPENKTFYNQNYDLLDKERSELSAANQERFDALLQEDWQKLKEINAFEQRLQDLIVKFNVPQADVEAELNAILFNGILVLADPDTGCNFDLTTLQYANGSKADPIAFLRINLFVRLWRKLGWSIEETDRALTTFIPQSTPFDDTSDNLAKQPLKTALIYLAHLKALDEKIKVGKQSLLKLLTLWSDIATTGDKPLYAQLFLNRRVLKTGEVEVIINGQPHRLSVFDDSLGRYLLPTGLKRIAEQVKFEVCVQEVKDADKIDALAFAGEQKISLRYDSLAEAQYLTYLGVLSDSEKRRLNDLSPSNVLSQLLDAVQVKAGEFSLIKGHVLALQGALSLTANEIDCILTDVGKSLETAELSLPNVSLLYRYCLLAKALKLSVRELIVLKQLSGLDPFTQLHPDPLADTPTDVVPPKKAIEFDYPFAQTLRFVEVAEEVKDSGLKIEDLNYLLRHCFDETGKYRPNTEKMQALLRMLSQGVRAIRIEHAVPDDSGAMTDEVLRQKLGLILPPDVVERFLAMMNGTAEFTATKTEVNSADKLNPKAFEDEPAIRQVSYNETRGEQKLSFRGILFDKEQNLLEAKYPSTSFKSFKELLDKIQEQQWEFFNKYMQQFFGTFGQLFNTSPNGASGSQKQNKLLWALSPYLGLVDPTVLADEDLLLTDGLLDNNLKSILPVEVADTFLKMWTGEIDYTAEQQEVELSDILLQSNFSETFITVSYTETQKIQSLTFHGVLLEKQADELRTKYPSPLFALLLNNVRTQIKEFYEKNLHTFFSDSDFNLIFNPIPDDVTATEKMDRMREKRAKLESAFLSYILLFNPTILIPERLKKALKRAFSNEVADTFLKMWTGQIDYTAEQQEVELSAILLQSNFSEPFITVSYTEAQKIQSLTFHGVLLEKQAEELKAKYPSLLFAVLLDDVQKQIAEFYEKNIERVLAFGSFSLLFTAIPADLNDSFKQSLKRQQQACLAEAFLPFLQQRLIRQFIVQTLTAHTGADPALVESLVSDERLLATADFAPLLIPFAEMGERGTTATYWFSADRSGVALATQLRSDDISRSAGKVNNPIRFIGTNRAELIGYLDIPPDDDYKFSVVLAKENDSVEMRIGEPVNPLIKKVASDDNEEIITPLILKRGKRYQVELVIEGDGASMVRLMVTSATRLLPKTTFNSCHLESYLEVPAQGAYRFNIELDKQNAEAELRFDHLADSLFLKGTAAADNTTLGNQPDEFLELKPGILYGFSLELKNLSGGGARLLVQGETLPKGPLSQLTLYPLSVITGAKSALLLLTKALQLAQSLGLSEREIRYLLTHADDFDNFNLSQLPTRSDSNTLDDAQKLFKQFLRLTTYVHLKRDLATGTDDLISIFETNGTGDLEKVYPLIVNLTRRDDAAVKATAKALNANPSFESEKPLLRLWEALQVVERFGVPIASLLEWTRIVSVAATPEQRFEIARDLKEAIKARFEPETWQRVAQPIFDKLRQRQRDALVAHVMHQHNFARMEQLYEYFLIDPGMEPVVQTSRIRLAIGSVQLFIQRCLLNLELKVHPSTINSRHWEWMKRYRVWEANRKIFLFPENWLEPEFRDDKTHLFSELEGTLLQGDVSSDLVEDAFLNYLKKLDELARLDIVAMHLEDKYDPMQNALHVIGRTYSQPHKYFYRRYYRQMWTPWEPVSAEIEGDHLAPVVWRDRLYLFWVTFMEKADPDAVPTSSTKKPSEMTQSELVSHVKTINANKIIEAHLHWSEYLQGEWSTRESGEFNTPIVDLVPFNYDCKSVFVHVSKAFDAETGEEGGVFIHLGGEIKQAFFLAGRNSTPEKATNSPAPDNPYTPNKVQATRYNSVGAQFRVKFNQLITTEDGTQIKESKPLPILQESKKCTLVPCDNNISLGAPDPSSLDADNPEEVAKAIETSLADIASLMKPVFYMDSKHTLFIEPSVTERTIEEWQEWVTPPPPDPLDPVGTLQWPKVKRQIPFTPQVIDSEVYRDPIDKESRIKLNPLEYDWLANPNTGLLIDGILIGPNGQVGVEIREFDNASVNPDGGTTIKVSPDSRLASGSTIVLTGIYVLEQSGLTQANDGLNVVSGAGCSSAQAQMVNELNY